MQGKRSAIGSLSDSMNFDYGSSSNNVGIEQQMCWNTLHDPAEASQETRNLTRWNIAEPSTRSLQINRDERISQNGWSSPMAASVGTGSRLEDQVYNPATNAVSRNGINLNLNSSFVQSPETNITHGSSTTFSDPFASSSRNGGFLADDEDSARRLSCKRKNIEGNVGQSSSSGSVFLRDGGSTWQAQALPPPHSNTETSSLNAAPNPRLRLSIGGESSRRNYRVRMNPRIEQDSSPNSSVSPTIPPAAHNRTLRFVPVSPPVDMNQPQPIQPVQRNDASLRPDLNSRPVPRNISEHPMFRSSVDGRTTLTPIPWNLNAASSSRAVATGPGSGPESSSGLTWGSHRHASSSSSSQHSRRLSEHARRSPAGPESGLHNNGSASLPRSSVPSTSGPQGQNRRGDAISGIPYPLRAWAVAGGEGRSRLVSEQIRTVLDMMRRGEGLRFEDVMFLDPSVLFGMADIHDEHRDMRLDTDNMSYEELLALEERIGNVSTGLTEETIAARMKQRKYLSFILDEDQAEVEPCCVCQEVYKDGDDIGTLDCGHDFHAKCIKQWLGQKNSCPICKTTGLAA